MRKLPLIFGFILTLILALGVAKATHIGYTFDYPVNDTTLFNETYNIINISISLNTSNTDSNCELMWNGNESLFTMASTNGTNTTYYYEWTPDGDNLNGNWVNLRFRCNETASWSNSTTSLLYFRRKEATYTMVDRVIVNNTVLSSVPNLNITVVSDNATNCTYDFNAAGVTFAGMQQSGNREYWTNSSELTWAETDYGKWHNISYNCSDSCGNYSVTGTYRFKVDTVKPDFDNEVSYKLGNYSTGGNYLEVTFNITDNNPGGCFLKLVWDDGTETNVSTEVNYTIVSNQTNCTANITPSDITKDGHAIVTPSAKDNAGYDNESTGTQSYIFYRLKTGWNAITGFENKTLSEIGGEFPNVTYVSVWDNAGNMKNFTTWTAGGSTNANEQANFSSNKSYGATYIYVAGDTVTMRRYYSGIVASWLNVTLITNTSTDKTTWNLVGVHKNFTNLNRTIMRDACTDSSMIDITGNCTNITWVSWYNIQLGEYCSVYRGRKASSCTGLTSTAINISRGDALWIATTGAHDYILDRNRW